MNRTIRLYILISSVGVILFFLTGVVFPGRTISANSASAKGITSNSPAIVIGFLGGFVSHDSPVRSEVQLAARLRNEYLTGVDVETFESYHGERARRKILDLLDVNHDGTLTHQEKQNARIIIYGHSWGGAESIYLARSLQKDGIPVLLTLQVDSKCGPGKNDISIPSNVAQAVNYYQSRGLLRGDHDIRAADATHTKIIGNFRFDYRKSPLKCSEYPWYDRLFIKPHTQIECDPVVWSRVESLIRSSLLPVMSDEAAGH